MSESIKQELARRRWRRETLQQLLDEDARIAALEAQLKAESTATEASQVPSSTLTPDPTTADGSPQPISPTMANGDLSTFASQDQNVFTPPVSAERKRKRESPATPAQPSPLAHELSVLPGGPIAPVQALHPAGDTLAQVLARAYSAAPPEFGFSHPQPPPQTLRPPTTDVKPKKPRTRRFGPSVHPSPAYSSVVKDSVGNYVELACCYCHGTASRNDHNGNPFFVGARGIAHHIAVVHAPEGSPRLNLQDVMYRCVRKVLTPEEQAAVDRGEYAVEKILCASPMVPRAARKMQNALLANEQPVDGTMINEMMAYGAETDEILAAELTQGEAAEHRERSPSEEISSLDVSMATHGWIPLLPPTTEDANAKPHPSSLANETVPATAPPQGIEEEQIASDDDDLYE